MKYSFRLHEAARRELRDLEQRDAMRILTAFTALGDDPYAEGLCIRKVVNVDAYRLRVGPVATGRVPRPLISPGWWRLGELWFV